MTGSEDAARRDFNMRVLKRHDASIEKIICSASFVVLYSHQGEWTKTGIEGPMFVYQRSKSPHHGFFIMNRNGVENFSASITAADDLELTPEFIIYHPSSESASGDDSEDEDNTYGIWIFEASQRQLIGTEMVRLQAQPGTVPPAKPLTAGQNIPLDALFGASGGAPPAPQPGPAAQATAPPARPTGLALMDQIFQSASTPAQNGSPSPNTQAARTSVPPEAPHESNGASAASAASPQAPSSGTKGSSGTGNGSGLAADLMSMLGITTAAPAPAPSQSSPASAPSAPSHSEATATTMDAARPQASASDVKASPKPAAKEPSLPAAAPSNGAPAANPIADSVQNILKDPSLPFNESRASASRPEPLARRDFVREVLSLIHTDPQFVDKLYADYLSR